MKTNMLKVFRRAFATHEWTPSERRAYARKWATQVRRLGSKWLALP